MSTVTYSNPEVQQHISAHYIPVQINVKDDPSALEQFNASWTPTIMVMDAQENEHRRSEGYFDPKRFLEELSLAEVKAALNQQDFSEAKTRGRDALAKTSGDPAHEPEAMFWAAVADYKNSKNADDLKSGWNKLLDKFPQSEWAHRVEFIRK
jgi:hypothetical protein